MSVSFAPREYGSGISGVANNLTIEDIQAVGSSKRVSSGSFNTTLQSYGNENERMAAVSRGHGSSFDFMSSGPGRYNAPAVQSIGG